MEYIVKEARQIAGSFLPVDETIAKVADYIPELSKANPMHMGVSVTTCQGEACHAGDTQVFFTIQSIVKTITLALALEEKGKEEVFSHVNVEPSGDSFNSILRLETGNGLPSNPMINAGAIAVVGCIDGASAQERFEKIIRLTKKLLGSDEIALDETVYQSEKETGSRNRSLAYMLETNGVIDHRVEEHLEVYFKACSILVNAEQLSYYAAVLANDGIDLKTKEQLITKETSRIIRSIMATCGMYDASGRFAVQMGFPAKSGVGGGIIGVVPQRVGICTFAPALDHNGNSYAGQKALEYLSKELDLFVY